MVTVIVTIVLVVVGRVSLVSPKFNEFRYVVGLLNKELMIFVFVVWNLAANVKKQRMT